MFRDMRRFRQQINIEECERILTEVPRGVLSVIGDGGYPYGVPINFVYSDGRMYFHSAPIGHKADAIRACGKASFCVLGDSEPSGDGWSYYFNSVIVFGYIREITDPSDKEDKLRLLGLKYFPSEAMVEDDIGKNAARCSVFELRAEHISGKRVHER